MTNDNDKFVYFASMYIHTFHASVKTVDYLYIPEEPHDSKSDGHERHEDVLEVPGPLGLRPLCHQFVCRVRCALFRSTALLEFKGLCP